MRYLKDEILQNGKYNFDRNIPLIKDPQPADHGKALKEIRYLKNGRTITIKGTTVVKRKQQIGATSEGEPILRTVNKIWYKTNKGYINEHALIGAEVFKL